MANPFSGIITSDFKSLYTNMIDSLLEDSALTVECKFTYEATKWSECPNCVVSPISGRSTNKYKNGGPANFSTSSCPICFGKGKIPDQSTELINLCVLWNQKEWLGNLPTNTSDGDIQTISKIDTLDNIRRTNEILVDTTVEKYERFIFKLKGDSVLAGLGASSYVFAFWGRNR